MLKFLCRLVNLTRSYKRKQKGVFFSEHSAVIGQPQPEYAYEYRMQLRCTFAILLGSCLAMWQNVHLVDFLASLYVNFGM